MKYIELIRLIRRIADKVDTATLKKLVAAVKAGDLMAAVLLVLDVLDGLTAGETRFTADADRAALLAELDACCQ